MPKSQSRAKSGRLILVCGDDDYAVSQRAANIFAAWQEETGSADFEIIDGAVANASEASASISNLLAALQTLPFFGGEKLVWWKQCALLGDARTATAKSVLDGLGKVVDEVKAQTWENARLLISGGKPDRRRAFYKALSARAQVESFEALSLDDRDWAFKAGRVVRETIAASGKSASDAVVDEIAQMVGPNPRALAAETEKLIQYAGDAPAVTIEDARAIVTRGKHARAFALADAVGNRDLPKALRALDEELWQMRSDRQKSTLGLLYGIISKIRSLILLKQIIGAGWVASRASYPHFKKQVEALPKDRLPADRRYNPAAINPYALYCGLDQARRYRSDELTSAMERLLECNRALVFSSQDGTAALRSTLISIITPSQS